MEHELSQARDPELGGYSMAKHRYSTESGALRYTVPFVFFNATASARR